MPCECHHCGRRKRLTHEVREGDNVMGRYCCNACAYAGAFGPNLRNGKWRIVWVGGNKR